MDFPFKEKQISENRVVRLFESKTESDELVWHRDREDRTITIHESNGWKIQYDNQLPVEMKKGDTFKIKAYEYHRVIKGEGRLVVEIKKGDTLHQS